MQCRLPHRYALDHIPGQIRIRHQAYVRCFFCPLPLLPDHQRDDRVVWPRQADHEIFVMEYDTTEVTGKIMHELDRFILIVHPAENH